MGIGSYTREAVGYLHDILYCGMAQPNPASDRICLIRPGQTLNNQSSKATFIAAECNATFGYERQCPARRIQSIASNVITIPEHNLPNNTEVFMVRDASASVSGLTTGTRYYVVNSTPSTFQLALTQAGSPVTTSSVSGLAYIKVSGAFDATDVRFESLFDPATFTATGGTISYQGYFILRNAHPLSNLVISTVNDTTDVITTSAAHGMTTGDAVMISTDSGSIPTGLVSTTIYFARVLTTTTFTLHPTSADAVSNLNMVNMTSQGSGTLRVRFANGFVDGFEYFSSSQSLVDTRSQMVRIFRNALNAGSMTGVA